MNKKYNDLIIETIDKKSLNDTIIGSLVKNNKLYNYKIHITITENDNIKVLNVPISHHVSNALLQGEVLTISHTYGTLDCHHNNLLEFLFKKNFIKNVSTLDSFKKDIAIKLNGTVNTYEKLSYDLISDMIKYYNIVGR